MLTIYAKDVKDARAARAKHPGAFAASFADFDRKKPPAGSTAMILGEAGFIEDWCRDNGVTVKKSGRKPKAAAVVEDGNNSD